MFGRLDSHLVEVNFLVLDETATIVVVATGENRRLAGK